MSKVVDWKKVKEAANEVRAHLHGKSHRTIRQEPYHPLTLEMNGDTLTCGYYTEENGDMVPDPVVRVNMDTGEHDIETAFGVYQDAAYLADFLGEVVRRLRLLPINKQYRQWREYLGPTGKHLSLSLFTELRDKGLLDYSPPGNKLLDDLHGSK